MRLSCRCAGQPDRPVLMLLHGFMGSTADWQGLEYYLQNHFFLVFVDLPGHGNSAVGGGFVEDSFVEDSFVEDSFVEDSFVEDSLDFDSVADAIEQLVDSLNLQKFSLLGYSLGGRLAMAYAAKYGHRLDNLLLEGAHAGLQSKAEKNTRRQSDLHWAERFSRQPNIEVLQDWYQQPVFRDLSDAQRQVLIADRQSQEGSRLAKVMTGLSLAVQPDFRPILHQLPCPVHYFVGGRDNKFSAIGQTLLSDDCLTDLHIIADSGHNVHREQPEALAILITQLITEVTRL